MVNHLQPLYLGAGYFPIFIVWRTGLFDAVKSGELVNRPLFQTGDVYAFNGEGASVVSAK
jgi:hypothetical protein